MWVNYSFKQTGQKSACLADRRWGAVCMLLFFLGMKSAYICWRDTTTETSPHTHLLPSDSLWGNTTADTIYFINWFSRFCLNLFVRLCTILISLTFSIIVYIVQSSSLLMFMSIYSKESFDKSLWFSQVFMYDDE